MIEDLRVTIILINQPRFPLTILTKESALSRLYQVRELLSIPASSSSVVSLFSRRDHLNTRSSFRENPFPLSTLNGDESVFSPAYLALPPADQDALEQMICLFGNTLAQGRKGAVTFSPIESKKLSEGFRREVEVTFKDNVEGHSFLFCPGLDYLISRTKLYDRTIFCSALERGITEKSEHEREHSPMETLHEGFNEEAASKDSQQTLVQTPLCTIKKTVENVSIAGFDGNRVVYLMDGQDRGELNIGLYEPPLYIIDGALKVRLPVIPGTSLDQAFAVFAQTLKEAMFSMEYRPDQPRFVRDHVAPIIFSIESLLRKGYNWSRGMEYDRRFLEGKRKVHGPGGGGPQSPEMGNESAETDSEQVDQDQMSGSHLKDSLIDAASIVGKNY